MAPRAWGTFLPVETPETISRRQFFQVLASRSMITRQEAIDAVTIGTLPAAIETLVTSIANDDVQFNVRMAFSAQTFNRSNWCVGYFGAMQNMSADDINELWRDGAKLD